MTERHKKELEEAEERGRQSERSKHGIVDVPARHQQSGLLSLDTTKPAIDPKTNQPRADGDEGPSREEQKHRVGSSFMKALDAAESGKVPGVIPGQ